MQELEGRLGGEVAAFGDAEEDGVHRTRALRPGSAPAPAPEVFAAASAGDRGASRRVYAWLQDAVPRIARRCGGRWSVSEDMVEDLIAEAMIASRGYRGESAPGTWLFGLTRRVVASRTASAAWAPGQEVWERLRDAPDEGPERRLESRRELCHLSDALFHLQARECCSIVAVTVWGVPIDELAADLEVKPEIVRQDIHRARKRLERVLTYPWLGDDCAPLIHHAGCPAAQSGGRIADCTEFPPPCFAIFYQGFTTFEYHDFPNETLLDDLGIQFGARRFSRHGNERFWQAIESVEEEPKPGRARIRRAGALEPASGHVAPPPQEIARARVTPQVVHPSVSQFRRGRDQ